MKTSAKIRVSLSEEATAMLLEIMKNLEISSPTHAANVAISKLHKQLTPSEVIQNDQRSPIHHQ